MCVSFLHLVIPFHALRILYIQFLVNADGGSILFVPSSWNSRGTFHLRLYQSVIPICNIILQLDKWMAIRRGLLRTERKRAQHKGNYAGLWCLRAGKRLRLRLLFTIMRRTPRSSKAVTLYQVSCNTQLVRYASCRCLPNARRDKCEDVRLCRQQRRILRTCGHVSPFRRRSFFNKQ